VVAPRSSGPESADPKIAAPTSFCLPGATVL
jgi:hypothetical protein